MIFSERAYFLVGQIPKGKVATYGQIAQALNSSPRAVGQALKHNPYAPKVQEGIFFPSAQTGKLSRFVPCHRVICSNGKIGGFKGEISGEEISEKIGLLNREGILISNGKIDLNRFGLRFL